jgi:hypothetical protein
MRDQNWWFDYPKQEPEDLSTAFSTTLVHRTGQISAHIGRVANDVRFKNPIDASAS